MIYVLFLSRSLLFLIFVVLTFSTVVGASLKKILDRGVGREMDKAFALLAESSCAPDVNFLRKFLGSDPLFFRRVG